MSEYNRMIDLLEQELVNDPLYKEIKKKKDLYSDLTSMDFIEELDENKWYSTVEASVMFGISDSKLRYYLKPFFKYVLPEDNPSSTAAYRLNYLAVVKLKMILLLKSEFKVAGLETLIGYRGSIITPQGGLPAEDTGEFEKRLDQVETFIAEIILSGLFNKDTDENGVTKLVLNEKIIKEKFFLPENTESIQKDLELFKEELQKEKEEKKKLREELEKEKEERRLFQEELRKSQQKEDVASSLREAQKRRKLELEAAEQWDKTHGGLKRLFAKEYDKRVYINEYVDKHLKINDNNE